MARFGVNDVDSYGSNGGGGWFSLKNDKDTAQVRFMYNNIDDVEGFCVHEVEIDGTKRYVNCLREAGESKDVCPMCAAGMYTTVKFFIPLYSVDEDTVLIWERGKKYAGKLDSLCNRYARKKGSTLVSHIFEIERNGKAGAADTTYETYEIDEDDTTLEDLPEVVDVLGTIVLDKTADEMEIYLETGEFPDTDDEDGDEYEAPVKRGGKDTKSKAKGRKVEVEDDEDEDFDEDEDEFEDDDLDEDEDFDEDADFDEADEDEFDDDEDEDFDDEDEEEEPPKKKGKAPAKKAPAKKTPVKKAPQKKAPAKAAPKKAPAKATAKKAPAKKGKR